MQFSLTDEQRQLRASVERFGSDHYGFEAWRTAARSDPGFRSELWRAMADMGWLAVAVPEAYGGLGLGARERAVIMEGLGRSLALEPYWSTAVLGAELLLAAGSEAHKRDWLPKLAEGSLRLAFAFPEAGTRYDWTRVSCAAERVAGGYRLRGRKIAVLDAPAADRLIVLARTGGAPDARQGLSLFCVDAAAAGLTRRDFLTIDERRCADIRFDGVLVDEALRLGAEGAAADAVQQAMDHAAIALCAESVGAMFAVLEQTVAYLKTRRQFGKFLSEFQALRHRVADMVMAAEQTRSLAAMAASAAIDSSGTALSRIASAAKAQAGEAGRFVGESAVQLHGGIGVTDELAIGHYLKRLTAIDFLLGDAAFHRGRFADLDPALAQAGEEEFSMEK
jgi:butyryl-CoA dehydrogenase